VQLTLALATVDGAAYSGQRCSPGDRTGRAVDGAASPPLLFLENGKEADMAGYGTVAHMRVKPGHEQQLQQMNEEFDRERGRSVRGFLASYVFKTDRDPNEFVLVAVFSDRDTYRANAEDPEQDRWYRQLREHLEADPEWTDGDVVFSSSTGQHG
jgi:quinol monooxygenase YgiN